MKGVISRYNTLEQANASLLQELMQKDDSVRFTSYYRPALESILDMSGVFKE